MKRTPKPKPDVVARTKPDVVARTKPDVVARWKTTRRRFLIGAGSLGVLAVGGYFGLEVGRPLLVDRLEGSGAPSSPAPSNPNLWFEIKADKIVFFAPKFEMGQGIQSALAQIAAEELEVDWQKLELKQPDSQHGFAPTFMFTFGSTSVKDLYQPIREMAASLREMLRSEAALQLGTDAPSIGIKNGVCAVKSDPSKSLTYGAVVAAKKGEWVLPKTPPALKAKNQFTTIGKPLSRLDAKSKVIGQPVYSMDARVEGMLYGAVARAPRFGAKLESGSAGQAESQVGVVKVVIDVANNFAGVVAQTRTQARNALKFLELKWVGGTNISQAELDTLVTVKTGAGVVIRNRGNSGLTGEIISASYRTPFAAHAHLEPLAALADVKEKSIDVWVGTQAANSDESAIKKAVPGNRSIKIYPMQMGGSFGRKGSQSAAPEAARLSAAVGKPVHVAWTREEEMQQSFYRPPTNTLLQATLENGMITGVQQVTASGDILFSIIPIPAFIKNTIGFDFGVLSGQFLPYDIANYTVRSQRIDLPIPTGPWRGVGLMPNVFALECFMDELAIAAKTDPLEFRLKHTNNPRMKAVLEDVKTRSNWTTPVPSGTARGVAYCTAVGTFVAMVVEIRLEGQQIMVERVTVSIDAGILVNPSNAALQARGSVVMGLSSTLLEKITIENGAVVQTNFKDYPLLTLKATPKIIDVHFMENSEAPSGMGEPVIGPVPAAVANALFALNGQRLRELPLVLG
jgi:isoquinoline 1-oxidoreductase subunit beta